MTDPRTTTHRFPHKPRVFILSDISNEPDDAESLVRYLLYSHQFQTEGLVACTSTWMRNKVCPQDMHRIIDAYERVVDNLNAHVHPTAQYLPAYHFRGLIRKGANGDDIPLSEGGQLLLERIQVSTDQPLWVLCWGGTNVLAQVLLRIEKLHGETEAIQLRSQLRVYAISDQDDTGAWIRHRYPDLFYIVSIHGWNHYTLAAWTGISGDQYYHFDQGGPDFSKMTKEWIKSHIQIGPLGTAYPDYLFIPEGDTPTFLYLIQNGLGVSEHPNYGSWGGRYQRTDISPNGLASMHYGDAIDRVIGADGRVYMTNHGTIWRWRDAFQNDFAAHMQWTLSGDFAQANHHPVISINGDASLETVYLEAEAGSTITLDASGTYDPDPSDTLSFVWFHYKDPSATQTWVDAEVADLVITSLDSESRKVKITIPLADKCCVELMSREPCLWGQLMHLILQVTDNGSPALTSYRRVLIQTTNPRMEGGGKGADAIGEVMAAMV
ncbi:DUF1593-domain-containing protein [Gymnopus androsaceus JB14]|uniref:DUF1593-domain-containing protein n=1 Tax=Gymnopus androsaceus JB14 TaxID=1447944 RepID=A0A6A4HXV6_9AGAR|nr:DUF1593-domain-containing protein [Gymnopus androsaceus JB14]